MGKTSKTRVVTYRYNRDFDESAMEKLLSSARERGLVSEYDTGRGSSVWFQGSPGQKMRELRKQVESIISQVREDG